MPTIEADHYREEVDRLAADPIIIAMANQFLAHDTPASKPRFIGEIKTLQYWDFTLAASRHYNERGGKGATSIGGPARAIRRLCGVPEPEV